MGFLTRKTPALRVYRVATGQLHAREHFAALFWPDHDRNGLWPAEVAPGEAAAQRPIEIDAGDLPHRLLSPSIERVGRARRPHLRLGPARAEFGHDDAR